MKKISYWNGIITHILSTGFLFVGFSFILNVGVIFFLKTVLNVAPYLIAPLLYVAFAVSIAAATYFSALNMKRYDIAEVSNLVDYS